MAIETTPMHELLTLDRESPLPLYAQVKRRLQPKIFSWPVESDRFHTDEELCDLFGVSRATVRKALAELEYEGLLHRRQGFGTFVNRKKIEESFSAQTNFSDQWAESGRSLSVELLQLDYRPCPAPFAETLNLEIGSEVLYLERFRLSGAMRIAWDRRYIPKTVAQGIPRKAFNNVSLLAVLGRKVEFDRGETQIESALAGEDYTEPLHLMPNDPVLIRHLVYFATDHTAVMAGVSIYRADQVRYKFSIPMRNQGGSQGGIQGGNIDAQVRVGTAAVSGKG